MAQTWILGTTKAQSKWHPIFFILLLIAIVSMHTMTLNVHQETISIYKVGLIISLLTCGHLSDYLGCKPLLISGLTLCSITSALCSFNLLEGSLLSIARFLQGMGCGTCYVLGRITALHLFPKEKWMKVLSSMLIGAFLIFLFFPKELSSSLEYESDGFLLLSLLSCVLLLLSLFLPEPSFDKHDFDGKKIISHFLPPIKSREFLGYVAIMGLIWAVFICSRRLSFFSLYNLVFFYPISCAWIETGVMFGYVLGVVFSVLLTFRYSLKYGLMTGCLTLFAGSFLFLASGLLLKLGLIPSLIPFFVIWVGMGMIVPTCQVAVMKLFSDQMGPAASLFYLAEVTFPFLLSLIFTKVNIKDGPSTILLSICLSLFLLCTFQLFIKDSKDLALSVAK